jgi:hypothetical protein
LVERQIHLIRGRKVMLDRDLAILYGIPAIALRQQVRRNTERFPDDFMLHLTNEEAANLVSQSVIPSGRSLGGSLPFALKQKIAAFRHDKHNPADYAERTVDKAQATRQRSPARPHGRPGNSNGPGF